MICLDCRRRLHIDPNARDPDLTAHLRECSACAGVARDQARLHRQLEAAMRLPVPEHLEARLRFEARVPHRRWPWRRAVAAAVLLVVATLTFLIGGDYYASHQLTQAIAASVEPTTAPRSTQTDTLVARQLTRIQHTLRDLPAVRVVAIRHATIEGNPAADMRIIAGDDQARIVVLPYARLRRIHDVSLGSLPGRLIPVDTGVVAVFCPDRQMLERATAGLQRVLAQPG